LALVVKQDFSEVTESQSVDLSLAFWYSHWNTEEGRVLASDSTKQVPPTAALLHQAHFSLPETVVMQVFSLVTESQAVVFKVLFWYSHWNTEEGRE